MSEQSENGTYTAYEAEYFKDGVWKKIPRKDSEYGASYYSDTNRNINKHISLMSYEQAQAIIWMAKCSNCMEYFLARIVPYKVEYKITFTKNSKESINIQGIGDAVTFSDGLIKSCENGLIE